MFGEGIGVRESLRLYFTLKMGDIEKYSSFKEMNELIDKKVEDYINRRSEIKIQEDTKVLDHIFNDVREAFKRSEEMDFFERRAYITPYLKTFFDKIKELYKDPECYLEYKDYLEILFELAHQGTEYPYLDEIEHETLENEPAKTLDSIVQQTRKAVCYNKHSKRGWIFHRECINCQKYLNEIFEDDDRIKNKPIDTYQDCKIPQFPHSINVVDIEGKKYIIDPTFVQFCDLRDTPDIVGVPGAVGAVPGQYLMETSGKREFLQHLIKYGFFEATEENLKMYFDAFVLANRDGEYYSKHPNASKTETEYNADDYIKMLMGKKTLDFGIEIKSDKSHQIESD